MMSHYVRSTLRIIDIIRWNKTILGRGNHNTGMWQGSENPGGGSSKGGAKICSRMLPLIFHK